MDVTEKERVVEYGIKVFGTSHKVTREDSDLFEKLVGMLIELKNGPDSAVENKNVDAPTELLHENYDGFYRLYAIGYDTNISLADLQKLKNASVRVTDVGCDFYVKTQAEPDPIFGGVYVDVQKESNYHDQVTKESIGITNDVSVPDAASGPAPENKIAAWTRSLFGFGSNSKKRKLGDTTIGSITA